MKKQSDGFLNAGSGVHSPPHSAKHFGEHFSYRGLIFGQKDLVVVLNPKSTFCLSVLGDLDGSFFGGGGEGKPNQSSFSRSRVDVECAAGLLHDSVNNRKPQARAFLSGARPVKKGSMALSTVEESIPSPVSFTTMCTQSSGVLFQQDADVSLLLNGLSAVAHEIEEGLFKVDGWKVKFGAGSGDLRVQKRTVFKGFSKHRFHLFDDFRGVNQLPGSVECHREGQELLSETGGYLGCAKNEIRGSLSFLAWFL